MARGKEWSYSCQGRLLNGVDRRWGAGWRNPHPKRGAISQKGGWTDSGTSRDQRGGTMAEGSRLTSKEI